MSDNTEISSKNFIVAEYNDIITNLDFVRNKRIFYLPERIYEKFPTLRVIEAQSCSILEITIANFAKLDSLEKLQLQNNQIETIPDKVFADLSSLKILRLSEYLLKFVEYFLIEGLCNQIFLSIWLRQ